MMNAASAAATRASALVAVASEAPEGRRRAKRREREKQQRGLHDCSVTSEESAGVVRSARQALHAVLLLFRRSAGAPDGLRDGAASFCTDGTGRADACAAQQPGCGGSAPRRALAAVRGWVRRHGRRRRRRRPTCRQPSTSRRPARRFEPPPLPAHSPRPSRPAAHTLLERGGTCNPLSRSPGKGDCGGRQGRPHSSGRRRSSHHTSRLWRPLLHLLLRGLRAEARGVPRAAREQPHR
jgi:hypothetical protein